MIEARRALRILPLLLATSLGAAVTTSAPPVRAGDTVQACIAANDKGMDLRKQGKLIDARRSFASCAVATCGNEIEETCEKRIADVTAALPTIIFVPKDAAGNDLGGVKAWMDGVVLAEALDGRPFTVDPGMHAFRFEAAGHVPVDKELVLNQKEKDRRETIVISPVRATPVSPPMAAPAMPPALVVPALPPAVTVSVPPSSASERASSSSPVRMAGYVVGGVGIVGLAVGSIFGVEAISKNNSAGCDASSYCTNPQSRIDARGAATVSTVGFITGGVLLAGGLVMAVVAPKAKAATTTTTGRWEAAPMVADRGGGLLLQGRW